MTPLHFGVKQKLGNEKRFWGFRSVQQFLYPYLETRKDIDLHPNISIRNT